MCLVILVLKNTPEGDVKLRIVGKNYTKVAYQYTSGDYYFSTSINPGKYSYSITYLGNSIFNPATYQSTYTIPKKSANLAIETKIGVKKLYVRTKLYDYNEGVPISGIIKTKLGSKTYYTKTNSNGIKSFQIPASSGKQKLTISFLGSKLYNAKTTIKQFFISSHKVVASKTSTKYIKNTEKGKYLCKKYLKTSKKYYFNGSKKTSIIYKYIPINLVKTANFGSGSSSKVVARYSDGYLEVDKYSFLKQIGIYDYISYDNRHLDYFKIYCKNGKTRIVECTHYYSDYWLISSIGVSKIKFYFYC